MVERLKYFGSVWKIMVILVVL